MDVLTTINRVLDRTEVIVDKVEPSQLAIQPSAPNGPCATSSITSPGRDDVRGVRRGSVPDDRLGQLMGGDNLGDDYKSAFHAMSTAYGRRSRRLGAR